MCKSTSAERAKTPPQTRRRLTMGATRYQLDVFMGSLRAVNQLTSVQSPLYLTATLRWLERRHSYPVSLYSLVSSRPTAQIVGQSQWD